MSFEGASVSTLCSAAFIGVSAGESDLWNVGEGKLCGLRTAGVGKLGSELLTTVLRCGECFVGGGRCAGLTEEKGESDGLWRLHLLTIFQKYNFSILD